MDHQTLQTTKTKTDVFTAILDELRLLRKEIAFLLPYENLDEYSNKEEIKNSYQKAIKSFPPVAIYG